MEPTTVRVGMMDSKRPESVTTVQARQLKVPERFWRAARRFLGITGLGLLAGNLALLILPFPHVHLCLFPLALVLGPLVGWFTWRDRVVLASSTVQCPRCHRDVLSPPELSGWPARFNCEGCGIRVELNPVG